MIPADRLLAALQDHGFRCFSGVPCSFLTPFIDTVIGAPDVDYIGAANEGEAIAIACGAQLGGVGAVAMFQNSGLGNAVNPLTSLTATFRIPILVITTLRGDPEGAPDEPQHELMGRITPRLLDLLEIPNEFLPADEAGARAALERAQRSMRERGLPYGLVLRKGSISATPVPAPVTPARRADAQLPVRSGTGPRLSSDDVLAAVYQGVPEADALITTTGFTGRALYAIGDRPNQLYMVGSMGCASSLALGIARALPRKRVVVVDGDGAVLMRMGALATLGFERPSNLLHILLDNGVHDSTGAQATVAPYVDFVAVAAACGYPRARDLHTLSDLRHELARSVTELSFLHVRTHPRRDRKLPRPAQLPPETAQRFRRWAAS